MNNNNVKPAVFESFNTTPVAENQNGNVMDLLHDVPIQITVELGRQNMLVKDVMNISVGQIIELDKSAGEHLDIFANGKLIAKGEVVTIDDKFGIRIKSVIK